MRTSALALAVLLAIGGTACSPAERLGSPDARLPKTATPEPVTPEPITSASPTPSPSADPTPEPTPPPQARIMREIAGLEFALVAGPADLRVETAVAVENDRVIAQTVAADVSAVERELDRSFRAKPLIYVLATTESYAIAFNRIFGYPRATATFVAENSVSFFEPSSRLIAVNWDAVSVRRPIAAIRHELTHLLTLDACAPRCDLVPAWLNEGQARLAEAFVPGGDWRLVRVRYEAASMAATGTLIPLNALVSQLSWNALTSWAGYYKYQQAARAVELLREDIGGDAPIARLYDRIRRGQNVAQAYAALTGRSFDEFVSGLDSRMRAVAPRVPGIITFPVAPEGAGASYLLYGYSPTATVTVTVVGPRWSESWPLEIPPFGASFEGIPATRAPGLYTISVQDVTGTVTVKIAKVGSGPPGEPH